MNEFDERIVAAGEQLIEVHDWLREELDRVRDGAAPSADILAHCAAFCGALTEHHSSEDRRVFTVLAREFPHLGPVLDELTRDHATIAGLLGELDRVLGSGASPADMRVQLDSIAALLEVHFRYEERKLVDALNASTVTQIRPRSLDLT